MTILDLAQFLVHNYPKDINYEQNAVENAIRLLGKEK